jgi:hypothetical protein
VYTIAAVVVVVPPVIVAVTTPVVLTTEANEEETGATDQVPPGVASCKVAVKPWQIVVVPVTAAG